MQAALLAVVLLASAALSLQRPAEIALADYLGHVCRTGGNAGNDSLRLLTLTEEFAPQMAERACAGREIGQLFDTVEISWRPRSHLTAQHILEGTYALFWNRRHLVLGMVPEFFDYYRPLVVTPRYPVYWFSANDQPVMTARYFADKVVGLVADTRSQTYYLQPMNALNRAGIHLADGQLRLYRDPQALYRAFIAGEVDLISSPRFLVDQIGLPYKHSLLINEDVPSGTWFVRKDLVGTGVECELIETLAVMSPMFPQGSTVAEGIQCR